MALLYPYVSVLSLTQTRDTSSIVTLGNTRRQPSAPRSLQALAAANELAEDMKGPGYKKGRTENVRTRVGPLAGYRLRCTTQPISFKK